MGLRVTQTLLVVYEAKQCAVRSQVGQVNKLQTESAEFANATSGKAENLSLVREMSGLST